MASDLDGTLLRSDGSISHYTLSVLQQVAAIVPIALLTARPPRTAQLIAAHFTVNTHLICCNGALVCDLACGRVMRHRPIAPEPARHLIETFRRALPGVVFAAELELAYACEPGYRALMASHDHLTDPGPFIGDALEFCAVPVTKLVVRHPQHTASTLMGVLESTLSAGFVATYSGNDFLEISASGVHKASALAALAEELHIQPQNVLAFGDMRNDIPMLAWAGRSIAVANAHPEVLAAAQETVPSNDEDGVALTLERLLLT